MTTANTPKNRYFYEGRHAFMAGQTETANPYGGCDAERRYCWHQGWMYARSKQEG
jgi:hypothetical protein